MDRKEGTEIMKEVYDSCLSLDKGWVALMPHNTTGVQSWGYQLHLKAKLNDEDRRCIRMVVDTHGLKIIEKADESIIYKPI